MTFLSTCCCGSTKSPPPPEPPTGCPDVCCNSCMWGDRITPWSGNPIDPNDDLVLYQGIDVGAAPVNSNLNDPLIKFEYKNMGAYWIWWNPSYMLNYTTNVPECESTEYVSASQFGGFGNNTTAPNTNLHKSRILEGDKCNGTLIPNESNEGDDANTVDGFTDATTYYGGGKDPSKDGFAAFFTTLKAGIGLGVNFFESLFFTGTLLGPAVSGPSKEVGYPCSTEAEDRCCVTRGIATNAGYGSTEIKDYCNKMGVSPYRRRIMKEHYPWAWQIFSYNEGDPYPFTTPVNYFEEKQVLTEESGFLEDGVYKTPLRAQILAFIQCEHHWGLGEANACYPDLSDLEIRYPLSYIIPRRFIYGCSAIPFFEFDIDEFILEDPASAAFFDKDSLITFMRSFTAFFDNPIGKFDPFPPQPYPDGNAIYFVREYIIELTRKRFQNILVKDWRQEAYEEIIIAESYYRESLGLTGITFDLFGELEIERPVPINGTSAELIQSFRNLPEYERSNHIEKSFPLPLGPVRKRRRALSVNGLFDELEGNELVNVFMPFDINKIISKFDPDTECMFKDENGDVNEELKKLQAMKYVNVFNPINKIWDTSYPDDDDGKRNSRKIGLIARLSQITYTYMLVQPGRWEFAAWGAGLVTQAGPPPTTGSPDDTDPDESGGAFNTLSRPENNWFFRKLGYVQGPESLLEWPSFSRVLAHSQLNNCTVPVDGDRGDFDFAWNPGTQCIREGCRSYVGPPQIGWVNDPYCGRSTYSQHPDVFLGTHSNPIQAVNDSAIDCPDSGGSEQYFEVRPAGRNEVSFVRYQSREMKWDTTVTPHRVIKRTEEEKDNYKNTTFNIPLTKTRDNCAVCWGQPCSSTNENLWNNPAFRSFNASCSASPFIGGSGFGTKTSGCAGVRVEIFQEDTTQIPYNNDIDIISYDFGFYGPIAFRRTNPNTVPDGVFGFNVEPVTYECDDTIQYDFCENTNVQVHRAITAQGDITEWPFGLPPQKFWEAAPSYPYSIQYGNFTGMFTSECCELVSKCGGCGLSVNFDENCQNVASIWCRSPKYPQEAFKDWVEAGKPTTFDFGQYSAEKGMVLAFSSSSSGRYDITPATGSPDSSTTQPDGYDNVPGSYLQSQAITPEFNSVAPTPYPFGGVTWGLCHPDSNNQLIYTSDNQFDCSKILFNVTKEQLNFIGMTNQTMINRYKGNFCACGGFFTGIIKGIVLPKQSCVASDIGTIPAYQCQSGPLTYNYGEFESQLNNPRTEHNYICNYIAISLCAGLKLYNQGLGKFTNINAPCQLNTSLYNGVTCNNVNDYLVSGLCYVAPDPDDYTPPDIFVYCDNFVNEICFDIANVSTPLDTTTGCCRNCLDGLDPFSFNPQYNCSECGGNNIFVHENAVDQQDNVQFANWAREQGLIGCWRIKQ